MNRRQATTSLATLLLAACGGGGGSPPAAPAPDAGASGGATVLRQPTTPNIALWGDSLVPPLAMALRMLLPDREIHDGGVPGETSGQVLRRVQADTEHKDWITVFWLGHNNMVLDAANARAQVKADLDAMVDSLAPGNNDYIVLSMLNNSVLGALGTAWYDTVNGINADLKARHPAQYLDIRALMAGQGDGSDRSIDVPASAFRADEIHLNGVGADFVAGRLKALLDSRGW